MPISLSPTTAAPLNHSGPAGAEFGVLTADISQVPTPPASRGRKAAAVQAPTVTVGLSGADILGAYGKDRPAAGFHESGWVPFIPGKLSREEYRANANAFIQAASDHGLIIKKRDTLQADGQLQAQVPATEAGGRQLARALNQFKTTTAGGKLLTFDDRNLFKLLQADSLGQSPSFMKGFKSETQKLWDEGHLVRGMNAVQVVLDVAGTRAGLGGAKGFRPLPAPVGSYLPAATGTTGIKMPNPTLTRQADHLSREQSAASTAKPAGTRAPVIDRTTTTPAVSAYTQQPARSKQSGLSPSAVSPALPGQLRAGRQVPGKFSAPAVLRTPLLDATPRVVPKVPALADIVAGLAKRQTNSPAGVKTRSMNAVNISPATQKLSASQVADSARPGLVKTVKSGAIRGEARTLTAQEKRQVADANALRGNPVQFGENIGLAKRRGVDFKSAVAGSTTHRVNPEPFDPAANAQSKPANPTPATSKKTDQIPKSADAVSQPSAQGKNQLETPRVEGAAQSEPAQTMLKTLNQALGSNRATLLVESYVASRNAGVAPFRAVREMYRQAVEKLGITPNPKQLAQLTQAGDAILSASKTSAFSTTQGALSREQLAQLTTRVDEKAKTNGRGGSLTTRATLESKISNNLQDQLFSIRDVKTGRVAAAAAVGSDVIRNHQGQLFDGVKIDYLSDGSDPGAIQKLTVAAYRYAQAEGSPLIIYPASEALSQKVYVPKLRELIESGVLKNAELLSQKTRDGETFFVIRPSP